MKKNRKQIRLRNYDYGNMGCYFITICSHNRSPLFSKIIPGNVYHVPEIRLLKIGSIVQKNIQRIPQVYSGVTVDNYVIMPNHVHLLISVHENVVQESRSKMLIPKIIQSFKASVTKEIPMELRPIWQARYYDHVVRDDSDFQIKWQYIENNPIKWAEDCYYLNDMCE